MGDVLARLMRWMETSDIDDADVVLRDAITEIAGLRARLDERRRMLTLTDAEREAVAYCVSCAQDYRETLDCCEQSEKYDRATRMIDAAMRLVILTVGPAPVERLGGTKVTDVGGAGPT